MPVQLIEGFDLGFTPSIATVFGNAYFGSDTSRGGGFTTAAVSIGQELRITGPTIDNGSSAYWQCARMMMPANYVTTTGGFLWSLSNVNTPNALPIVAVSTQAGTPQVTLAVTDNGTRFALYRANSTSPFDTILTSVLLPSAIVPGTRYYIEVTTTINGTTGSVVVALNGSVVLNATNINTLFSSTVGAGAFIIMCGRGTGSSRVATYDHAYISDGAVRLGPQVVRTIRPNGVGASSQWTPTGAATGWQATSDDSDASYVQSGTVGHRDLYDLGSPPNLDAVAAVQVQGRAAKVSDGVAPAGVLSALRGDGGTVTTPALAPLAGITTTPAWFHGAALLTDPDGDAWTPAGVDGLQAGPQVG